MNPVVAMNRAHEALQFVGIGDNATERLEVSQPG